jgi:O-antigen biosynthesis protein
MTTLPAVTVIILNWNGGAYLLACLEALLAVDYPDYRVIVVDNASGDGSPDLVRRRFAQVEVIETGHNLGFAGGNNVALRRLETEYAVLLNPDVVVSRHWLRGLITPMASDPSIGIAGCKLTFPDGRIQHAGGFIAGPQALPGHYGLNEVDEGQHDSLRDVEYVTGAAMAVTRPLLERIGLMDEGYFLYYEEVDFCRRARQAGFRVVYVPGATAMHDESALSKRGSPAYLEQMHSGRWRFLLKHEELENVCREAVPAEKVWLETIGRLERLAVRRVYQKMGMDLAAIWRARRRDGESPMNEVTETQIDSVSKELAALEEAAAQPGAQASLELESPVLLALLHQKWSVSERPFTSEAPVIGGLIAAVRTVWNNIATKWYVRPMVQQQNEFNLLVAQTSHTLAEQINVLAEQINGLAQQINTYESWLMQQDRAATHSLHDMAETNTQLIRMNRLLQSIDERLNRLENGQGEKSPR